MELKQELEHLLLIENRLSSKHSFIYIVNIVETLPSYTEDLEVKVMM